MVTRRLPLLLAGLLLTAGGDEKPVDFVRDVRPLLREHCLSCHGPQKSKGRFRLDRKAAASKGGLSGKAIVPGKSAQSPLFTRLLESDPDARMPQKAPPLAREQIDLLRRWIDEGAAWPEDGSEAEATHWAYTVSPQGAPPEVRNPSLVRNPIDRFVLSRLEKEKLDLSPEAPREVLIRRVSLDLTGLPPSVEEVDAFVKDPHPKAYEQVVDRLLDSPHYGEHWARLWLDLARYADSNGYERDGLRTMWKYRDWVIRAFNEDKPFTHFTREQLAGDLIAGATLDQRIATGFLRNSMLNEEDGVDKDEARWNTLVERVGTVATVWLGTTLACAQCHNHKYDPFTQKDFYRLLAFFETSEEPTISVPTPDQEAKKTTLEAEIAALEETLRCPTPALQAWQSRQRRILGAWRVLEPFETSTSGDTRLEPQSDGSLLATGPASERETYRIAARTDLRGITAFRLEALTDPSLPGSGPGRAHNGDFVLSEFKVAVDGTPVVLQKPVADFASKYAWITEALDGKSETGWAIGPQVGKHHTAFFETRKPLADGEGTVITVVLDHQSAHPRHALGRFRLSALAEENPTDALALPAPIRSFLEMADEQLCAEEKQKIWEYYASIAPELKPARERIARCRKEIEALGIPTALVLRERPGAAPSTHVRLRGNFLAKGEEVSAGIPAALNNWPVLPNEYKPNRLGLAQWLVDRNPLTARVLVNRFWGHFFGRGLVETCEDFGTQGATPTHPELLDWLAEQFRSPHRWSMKAVHRTIVTSAVYRQSSRVPPSLRDRDPENRLLARGPSFRLDAETIRDVALAASGLLSRKIGGPSVYPPQPEGTWNIAASKESEAWTESRGEDRWRRGLYVFWRRSAPYPSFVTFDAPSREFCTARRARTTTPLQALTLLNDPAFFEAARALAARMIRDGGDDTERRITFGYRLCCSRTPRPEERRVLVELYERSLARLGGAEQAAMTMVANALLNLDETVTKD